MGIRKIDSADYTDMTNAVSDYSVDSLDTEGPTGYGETTYTCNWMKWHGYYRKIPELAAVIDKKALWSVGKGCETEEKTKKILDRIRGWGKDSFDSLAYNWVRTYTIGGDSYSEIIRDKAGRLINLKPLNPGSIKIVMDKWGIIKRYEQTSQLPNAQSNIKFNPKDILHFAWNRIADEGHGISTIEKCEDVILMRNEAMADMKKVFHRYVKPLLVTKVKTDDTSEIATFKDKLDKAVENAENLIIPEDTVADMERVSIPQYSTLDPLPWIKMLQKFFIMAEGVPEVVLGQGEDTTEATSKILYLAFQQMVEWNQLFLEREIKNQLGLEVDFKFPASIEPDLLEDNRKDVSLTSEKVNPRKDGK